MINFIIKFIVGFSFKFSKNDYLKNPSQYELLFHFHQLIIHVVLKVFLIFFNTIKFIILLN